ncbi:MAG: nuclear transport factor 2 family protein [Bacteroidia bacterium]|nr:nuclear transport factor 2 family protein [Bacteroidia bacterium]
MTTSEIAQRLATLVREGKSEQAVAELYSPDIVSIEPEGSPNPIVKGLDGIKKKWKEFDALIEEVHSTYISDPQVADDFFSLTMKLDVTMTGYGRIPMNEVCVYGVTDGKIVLEQFFYKTEPQ